MFGLTKKIRPKLWPWWRTSLTFWVVLCHIGHKTWSDWAFYHRYSPLEMSMMRGPINNGNDEANHDGNDEDGNGDDDECVQVHQSCRDEATHPSRIPLTFLRLPPFSATHFCHLHLPRCPRLAAFSSSILLFLFLHISSFSFLFPLLPPSLA